MKGRRSERQQSSRKESREHLSASDILRERERSTRQRVPLPPSDELKKRVRDRVSHSSLSLSLSLPPSLLAKGKREEETRRGKGMSWRERKIAVVRSNTEGDARGREGEKGGVLRSSPRSARASCSCAGNDFLQ